MVLCFRFRIKIMLIMHGCFSCCSIVLHRTKNVSASHAALCESEGVQRVGRGQNQHSWQKLAKEMSHTIWCGKKCHMVWNTLWMLYIPISISCPIKLSLSQPMSSIFYQILSPSQWGWRNEWTAVWCSAACQGKPRKLGFGFCKQKAFTLYLSLLSE